MSHTDDLDEDTKTVQVIRRVPEWRVETWHVPIPANTPEDEARDAALDAMCDGWGEIVADESDGYVEMLDRDTLESHIILPDGTFKEVI